MASGMPDARFGAAPRELRSDLPRNKPAEKALTARSTPTFAMAAAVQIEPACADCVTPGPSAVGTVAAPLDTVSGSTQA
jgi:hypothetical protein